MEKTRRKLDNAALAFPAATDKNDTRVFRVSCVLTDTVQESILQKAVAAAVVHYPLFQCILKRGNFWFYFERAEIEPVIKPEDDAPCQELYNHKKENLLLYQVTYGKHAINLEMFHALTDGTGAIEFLSDIVKEYLKIAYDIQEDSFVYPTGEEQQEDSFSKYYSEKKQAKLIKKSSRAFQISDRKLATGNMRIYEYTVSAEQLLKKAREYHVSITVYLTALFLCAVAESMTEQEKKKPVTLMIPVNLRKFYPSRTMSNFFGWMEIDYLFKGNDSLERVIDHVKRRFEEDLLKEQVAARMNRYVKLEKNIFMRFIPLRIKDIFLRCGTKMGSKNVTGVFSNMGVIRMPDSFKPYIQRFGAIASTERIQMCSCSYDDRFYFSITSKYAGESIPKVFIKSLRESGIELTEE